MAALVAERNETHLSILAVGYYFSRTIRCVEVTQPKEIRIILIPEQKIRIDEIGVEISSSQLIMFISLDKIVFAQKLKVYGIKHSFQETKFSRNLTVRESDLPALVLYSCFI